MAAYGTYAFQTLRVHTSRPVHARTFLHNISATARSARELNCVGTSLRRFCARMFCWFDMVQFFFVSLSFFLSPDRARTRTMTTSEENLARARVLIEFPNKNVTNYNAWHLRHSVHCWAHCTRGLCVSLHADRTKECTQLSIESLDFF